MTQLKRALIALSHDIKNMVVILKNHWARKSSKHIESFVFWRNFVKVVLLLNYLWNVAMAAMEVGFTLGVFWVALSNGSISESEMERSF